MPLGRGSARRAERRSATTSAHDNDLESTERFTQRTRRSSACTRRGTATGSSAAPVRSRYRMSVPGGAIPAAGVTVVGVLPTHRRRGVLTALMREQLADCRARGEPAAYLWASESTIYPRFGYGLAALMGDMRLARERTAFAQPFEPRGTVRLVDVEEAARTFPPLYEQMFAQRPGLFSPDAGVVGGTPARAEPVGAEDGEAARAARARRRARGLRDLHREPGVGARVVGRQGDRGRGGRADARRRRASCGAGCSTSTGPREFEASLLPLDHPLFLLLAEPRRMRFEVGDGIWVRLIDVEAALAARSYEGDTQVVVELTDAFLPENAGRWRLGARGAERTNAARRARARRHRARLCLPRRLLVCRPRARLPGPIELAPGAVARADALFRNDRAAVVRGSFLAVRPSRQQAFRRLQSLFWGRKILWRTTCRRPMGRPRPG